MCFKYCVLSKLILVLEFMTKTMIYICFMYIGLCFKMFKYHVFVFGRSFGQNVFSIQNPSFRKYSCWFLVKMLRDKNSSY